MPLSMYFTVSVINLSHKKATDSSTTAMRDALENDFRLHRDISIGNVILVREPEHPIRRGYLVDWEGSCQVDDTGKALEPGRAVRFANGSRSSARSLTLFLSGYLAFHVLGYGDSRRP